MTGSPSDDARDLKLALDRREFVVYYQPVIAVASSLLVGAEALVRWAHPTRGLLAPLDFLPAAEQTGLIVDIGYLVFEDACSLLSLWRDASFSTLSVSVNVSRRQLTEKHLKANVGEILQTHDVDPGLVEIEVSQDLLDGGESLNGILDDLHNLGLRLALDDFGSGGSRYAPLNALRGLPFDIVKVDRSVIAQLDTGEFERELTEAALDFTKSRGLTTVAEGVERPDQLDLLRHMECDRAQGYLLGEPQVPSEVTAGAGGLTPS